MAISDILVQLKNTVLGVKSTQIDNLIDSSLDQISKYSSNNDTNKFIDAFKDLIKNTNTNENSFLKSLDNGNPQVQNYDQSGRIGRYQEYDSICSKIPYCQRALETWVDHIVSPDDILKTTLEIIVPDDEENDNQKLNIVKKRIQTLIQHFDIDNKTKNIVRTTLKKGDNFLELVITKNGKNSLVVLNESDSKNVEFLNKRYKYDDGKEKKSFNVVIEDASQLINFGGPFAGLGTLISSPNYPNLMRNQQDISGIPEWSKDSSKSTPAKDPAEKKFKGRFDDETDSEVKEKKEKRGEFISLNDLSLVVHDPKYVIRLETQRYRICLGYLVFPKVDVMQINAGGVTNNIDGLCIQLLDDIKTRLSLKGLDDKIELSDDIKKVLLSHISKITKNEDLKIRYVSPHLMTHFKLDSLKYNPYGESIFDCIMFQCRLYIALQTALTVKKINSCSDKRFVNIEMGLPRDAAQLVERMKDAITKKKISVGSLGNIDTIPSQISTFETIYLPQKDGKKFIEIDHQQWGGDPSNDADQLKQMRDGIVGSLGVPSAYLNIEENCLPYDTKISLLDGSNVEIGRIVELWEENENNRNVWVYSIDPETKNIVPGKITQVFRTRKNAQLVRVHLDNGEYVDSTPDHRFMLRDGSYTEAQNLKPDDSLMPLYKNHKVVRVEWLEEKKDCYDIEVDKYHNFAVSAGVFVHNSSNRSILTTESINFARSVISRQQELSIYLWEFFYKAFTLVWGKQEADLLKNVKITFQIPKISPAEHFNEILQNTSAVIGSLTDLGIPKEYLKRKFLPYIDWDDVENYIAKEKLTKETGDMTSDDGGMMGGMGMSMGGGMGGGMDMGGGMPPM